ncbi:MAG: sodium/proline symporter [Lachnospiraceae bacterium]|nr:sodium/proline symporter [Lachnospiraceae bacterium]
MLTQSCIILAIVAYLALMIIIGISFSKKNNSTDDFYLGGRKLGPIVTAMSAEASDMSSWLLMGLPGVAYLSGVADAGWTAIGLAVGTYINWLIVSKKIRRYSQELGAITLPDFFSKRYGDNKNILTAVAAIIIIIFFIPYTASGFSACGKLFMTLFGMDYMVAMIASAIIIVTYCAFGGFLAASTTDLIQSIVMTIALFVVIIFGTVQAGGIEAVSANAAALPGYLSLAQTYSDGAAKSFSILSMCSAMAWGLGYFGMPHILLRFMAIEDEKKLSLSRRVATIWVVISMAVAILIGIVGYGMSQAGTLPVLEDSETIIIEIARLLSTNGVFPALIAGVIMAGILAATMSTADSQLLTAASGISQNIVQDFFGIKLKEKTALIIARITVIAISIIAIFLARDPNSSVFKIVSFAWAGFGATFGPVMLCALFWKRSNKQGALAGMIAGGAMVFIWKFGIAKLGGAFAIYELLPAFFFACIVNVIVSLATAAPAKELVDTFEKVSAK